jgi:hypothetical protein
VTCRPKLVRNVGELEAGQVFAALRESSLEVVDLDPSLTTAEQAAAAVRPRLKRGGFAGVVLLGGYDVVPAYRLDVIDAATRRAIRAAGQDRQDSDDFIVWSDQLYGDHNADTLPEMPVSRVPDGRRKDVLLAALAAPRFTPGNRFGVGNQHRPFAVNVFPGVPGRGGQLQASAPHRPGQAARNAASAAVYFMLHGSWQDGTLFMGEEASGETCDALDLSDVPSQAPGAVVFAGCCWGALVADPPAARVQGAQTPLRPRGPERSIAVKYLLAGASAFVGCTGTHYSPGEPPYDYYGKPMHDAFWANLKAGRPPAEALYLAKKEFARRMPHGRTDPFSRAVELKILRQFVCLGLGW